MLSARAASNFMLEDGGSVSLSLNVLDVEVGVMIALEVWRGFEEWVNEGATRVLDLRGGLRGCPPCYPRKSGYQNCFRL